MAIHYTEKGTGPSVILIHGFPFNQTIWNGFADELARKFRVFTIDLPGFGKSALLKPSFSLEDVASEINLWRESLKISNAVVVGHSLGGYVALALADQFPQWIHGLVLFHSSAYADSTEKKESRNKVLDFISKNGVQAFTAKFIPPLFADQAHPAIAIVRDVALQASREAVEGYTIAMRDRIDRSVVLTNLHKPILIISGSQDTGIPIDSVEKLAGLSDSIDLQILANVAHMGMFEDKKETVKLIADFISKSNRP
jgi:pimeloyl-ACP methyl ester carboxylesterase